MSAGEEVDRGTEAQPSGWRPLSEIFDTKEACFGKILFLPGYGYSSNIYAIKGKDLTIVDPGNDYTAFLELFNFGVTPRDIGKIVLTHGHRDHATGAFELLRSYSGAVKSGALELILHQAGPGQIKKAAKECGYRVTEVRGGEVLELGGLGWEVIHTPGHTIDGICLYHAESRTAITGDVVLPDAMAEPDPAAGGRLDHYLFGLRTLLEREIEHVLPGHGAPMLSTGGRVIEETYVGVMMKAIGVEPESRTPWVEGAAKLAGSGFLQEALYCCEKELARNSEEPRALQLKVLALTDLGRFDEALSAVERIEKTPSVGRSGLFVPIARGYALMGMGKYLDSIQCFDEALGIQPGMKDALVYKGMALYLSGNPEQAMEIEPFRAEFVGRFKEEALKNAKTPGPGRPDVSTPSGE